MALEYNTVKAHHPKNRGPQPRRTALPCSNRSTTQGAEQIFTDFGNPTQIQLGAVHAAITNYNGLATYTVMNTASVTSLFYHKAPDSWNHNVGPVPGRNIYQVFHWSEASPCD